MFLLQGADVRSHYDYLHLRPNRTHIHIDIMSKTYFGEHQIHLSASVCLCQTAGEFEIISYQGIYKFADYFWKYVSGGRTPSRHSTDPYGSLVRMSSMQVAVGVDEKIVLYLTTHCWYHHGNANSGACFNSYLSYPVYTVIAGLCRNRQSTIFMPQTGLVCSGWLNTASLSTMSDDVSNGYSSGIYLVHHLRVERGRQFFQGYTYTLGTLAAVMSFEPIKRDRAVACVVSREVCEKGIEAAERVWNGLDEGFSKDGCERNGGQRWRRILDKAALRECCGQQPALVRQYLSVVAHEINHKKIKIFSTSSNFNKIQYLVHMYTCWICCEIYLYAQF